MSLQWCGGTSEINQLDLVVLTQMWHLMSGQLSWQHQKLPVIMSDERSYGPSKQAPRGSQPQTDTPARPFGWKGSLGWCYWSLCESLPQRFISGVRLRGLSQRFVSEFRLWGCWISISPSVFYHWQLSPAQVGSIYWTRKALILEGKTFTLVSFRHPAKIFCCFSYFLIPSLT